MRSDYDCKNTYGQKWKGTAEEYKRGILFYEILYIIIAHIFKKKKKRIQRGTLAQAKETRE